MTSIRSTYKSRSALVIAALATLSGAANATLIDFEPGGGSELPFFLAHGEVITQAGYDLTATSYRVDAMEGDLVGAFVDGANLADTCLGLTCPSGNSSHFYAGVNDGVLRLDRQDGALFTLAGFDVGFLGAGSAGSFPDGIPLVMKVQGTRADNSSFTATVTLGGPVGGGFQFESALMDAAFASTAFKSVHFYGLPCDADGYCTGFVSNKGQFALDNINASIASAVPEPDQWLLTALGLVAMGGFVRRRRHSA